LADSDGTVLIEGRRRDAGDDQYTACLSLPPVG